MKYSWQRASRCLMTSMRQKTLGPWTSGIETLRCSYSMIWDPYVLALKKHLPPRNKGGNGGKKRGIDRSPTNTGNQSQCPGSLTEWLWKRYLTALSFSFIYLNEKQIQRIPWLCSHYNAGYSLHSYFWSHLQIGPESDTRKSLTLPWVRMNSSVRLSSDSVNSRANKEWLDWIYIHSNVPHATTG